MWSRTSACSWQIEDLPHSESARVSENLLLRGHHQLEFGIFPQPSELRLFEKFLAVLEALFEGLANVLNRAIVQARLRVGLGDVVMILGALLHGLILNRCALGAAPLENIRVDAQSLAVGRGGPRVLLAREVSRAQIGQEWRKSRTQRQSLAVLRNGPAVGFTGVINRT